MTSLWRAEDRLRTVACVVASVLAEGEPCFVHLARVLPREMRPRRALRTVRAPRDNPSSRTARRRSFDVTPLTGRPVTLARGDCADLATGVTAYTRPSWRRIWTSPSRDASSSTSARRWRAVEYVLTSSIRLHQGQA
jgi:hypothetical protein